MHLREEHLLRRPALGTPELDVALQRPQLVVGKASRITFPIEATRTGKVVVAIHAIQSGSVKTHQDEVAYGFRNQSGKGDHARR